MPITIGMGIDQELIFRKLVISAYTVPIPGAFLICMVMFGSGPRMLGVPMHLVHKPIHLMRGLRARSVSFGVVRGTVWLLTCVQPTATTSPRATAQRNLGFRLAYRQITEPPRDLSSLDFLTVTENEPIGTIVGEFNATDPEGGAVTYSLISGDGFTLDANGTLKTAVVFDYETDGETHEITVQAKDELNATVEGNFTVYLFNDPASVFVVSGGQFGAPYYEFTNGLGEEVDFASLNLKPGEIYQFMSIELSSSHPFMIGENYGDMDSPMVSGEPLSEDWDELTVTIPSGFSGDLYYFCTNHSDMIQGFTVQGDTPLDDSNFHNAIALWFSDEGNATAIYGHISDWNTSAVTNMSGAFEGRSDFNEFNWRMGYFICDRYELYVR